MKNETSATAGVPPGEDYTRTAVSTGFVANSSSSLRLGGTLGLVTILTAGLLWGCAQLQTKVGPEAAKAIKTYCLEPQATRLVLREEINRLIAPNMIKITCEGDET